MWTDGTERDSLVRCCAMGGTPLRLPGNVTALVTRSSPVADVMNDVSSHLHRTSRHTDDPARDLRTACTAAGLTR